MAAGRRIRILIVDDSAVMRSLLRSVITADAGLEVAGTAADGASALQRPPIAPSRSGSAGCGDAGDGWPGDAEKIARAGAQNAGHHVQFAHPARRQGHHRSAGLRRQRLRGQARRPGQPRSGHQGALAGTDSQKFAPSSSSSSNGPFSAARGLPLSPLRGAAARNTGDLFHSGGAGHRRLHRRTRRHSIFCFPRCRQAFRLPVLIVQHMPELFTRLFAERLNGRCRLPVREASRASRCVREPSTSPGATGTWRCWPRAHSALRQLST